VRAVESRIYRELKHEVRVRKREVYNASRDEANERRSCEVQDMRNEKPKYKERYAERNLKSKVERVSILWYSPFG